MTVSRNSPGVTRRRERAATIQQMTERYYQAADSDDDPSVLLECLRVPPEYCRLEVETGIENLAQILAFKLIRYLTDALKLWKDITYSCIRKLKDNANRIFSSATGHTLMLRLAALIGDDNFCTSPIRDAANGKLRTR